MPEYEAGGDLFQVLCEVTSSYRPDRVYKFIKERDTGRVVFAEKIKGTKSLRILWAEDLVALGRTTRVDQTRKKPMGGPIGE